VNGNAVKRGDWPWLTAIFVTTQTGLEFICGGTLISKNHVITGCFLSIKCMCFVLHTLFSAAHCVWQQSKKLKPEALLIYLGKHDLFNWNEQDVQSKDVSKMD
jgi:Trypsin